MKEIFKEMGKRVSPREFMRAMDQIDADGSGEVSFAEFVDYWDRTMTASGVVVPSTFMFDSLCVRAVLKSELDGGRGEHHWIADDIANILYSPSAAECRANGELIPEQSKLLQDLWTAFDADGSGTLEHSEVRSVIEAAMERELSDKELDDAFKKMDADGSGQVDFHEFSLYWATQGEEVRKRIMLKAFEETMSTLGEGDVSKVIIDTASGPEQVRLVSPRGLFRLVIRSKSPGAKHFHHWVQTLVTDTRKERASRRKAVFAVPDCEALCKDFVLRNQLVTAKNCDGWLFHKTEAVGVKATDANQSGSEVKIFTLPGSAVAPHKPQLLCVKGYTKLDMPPEEVDRRLWNVSKRHEWDLLSKSNLRVLRKLNDDALVTQHFFEFEYPYLPSPVAPVELLLAHTRRIDTDGTIVHASGSGAYDGLTAKPRDKKLAVLGEVFCSGIIITPLQKGEKSGLTIITCIQGGADGPDRGVPVVSQTLFKSYFISNQVDAIYDFLSQAE